MLKAIVAIDAENGIGIGGKLPWHYPKDLQYFKETTRGKSLVVGRKTFESLPDKVKNDPDRHFIVLSRSFRKYSGNAISVSLEDLPAYLEFSTDGDVWVIGGAEIYKALSHLIVEWHVTIIKKTFECDTYLDQDCLLGKRFQKSILLEEDVEVTIWR